MLRYIPIVLSGVEMRVLPDLQEANGLARDESAGGDVSERIAIERFVVHIDADLRPARWRRQSPPPESVFVSLSYPTCGPRECRAGSRGNFD